MTAKQNRRKEQITELISYNKRVVYQITEKHKRLAGLNWYIGVNSKLNGASSLRETLLSVLTYIGKLQMWRLSNDGFVFFIDTERLTCKVRGKSVGRAVSNHHINLLCAIGLFEKVDLNSGDEERILKPLLTTKHCNPVSAFKIRRYDSKQLQRMEQRAEQLQESHVTTGNVSYGYLMEHSITDIAEEVYYRNNKYAPYRKRAEWSELQQVIDGVIDLQGYATKEDVMLNCLLSDYEIKMLFTIYKDRMRKLYNYRQPTKEQIAQFGLCDRTWIITRCETYDLIRNGDDLF